MRVSSFLGGALALLAIAAPDAGAQWPGGVRGDVVDALSGRPVPSAAVGLSGTSAATLTDASGAFHLRGIEPGTHTLLVQAPGYARHASDVVVRNGGVTDVRMELVPTALELDGLTARIDAGPGSWTLTAAELAAVPARTAGDLMAGFPGVLVTARGRGASEVPSIRGSGGDAVLVLVDGVPINDPLTGEADLSTVPASSVSEVRVLPGGRSARYGARAEGGVILIETGERGGHSGRGVSASMGSLGEWSVEGTWRHRLPLGAIDAWVGLRRLEGRFDFEIPEDAGGGRGVRENAHVDGDHARLEWGGETATVGFRLGAAGERLERGLPGRSFMPSLGAEQALERVRLFGSIDTRRDGPWDLAIDAHATHQRVEHRDPAPPFGEPFEDRTTLFGGGVEARVDRDLAAGTTASAGASVGHLRIRSTQLDEAFGDLRRTDTGGWLGVAHRVPASLTLSGTLRVDRSALPTRTYLSHDLAVAWTRGGYGLRVGHRSSFSPPTLGDQFFREGVGVEPNPDLEPERVPSEWLVGLRHERTRAGAAWSVEAEAYRGDIRGMILWLPDFRFVWSPSNQNVRRHGIDLGARVRRPGGGIDLRAHLSWNRTTYDQPGLEDVQVIYRPELTGGVVLSWSATAWRASVSTDHVGARHPVPGRANELEPFWTTDVTVARRFETGPGTLELRVDVERVFDNDDALIHAFPDPGRTLRLGARFVR